MNYKTRMLALLALFLLTISVSRASQTEEKDYVGYLFTYFTGNHISEEAVCFAVSMDGYSFYALNGNKPVLDSKVNQFDRRCTRPRISCGAKTERLSTWS